MNQGDAGPALVLIDVQRAFDDPSWGTRNNPEAEARIAELLAAWREAGLPVLHVRHASRNPASTLHETHPGFAFKPQALPAEGEPVIRKDVNAGFIGTDLEARLRGAGIASVVLAGLTTDHCVSTTARMAGNLGFDTYVAADATATFDRAGHDGRAWPADALHDAALASLHGEFATVLTTEDAIARFALARV